MKPYFGITDCTVEGVRAMEVVMRTHRPTVEHLLHVGVMMSRKTFHGLPTSWADVWPKKKEVKDIFFSDSAYNCLHYADYPNDEGWREDIHLDHVLDMVAFWGGPKLHALQLDMIWPNAMNIGRTKRVSERNGQHLEIILQVNTPALACVDDDPRRLVVRLREYGASIDRILLDKSMGKGDPLDPQTLLPFVRAVREGLPDLGIGIAGGLSAKTMHLMEPIWEEFPDVSIDAQGGLRPSRSAKDPVDWSMARDYLIAACATRAKYNKR